MTMKTASYFRLICANPFALSSNVVHKFTCSCDTDNTYIGMTTRHMEIRVTEKIQNQQSKVTSRVIKHV